MYNDFGRFFIHSLQNINYESATFKLLKKVDGKILYVQSILEEHLCHFLSYFFVEDVTARKINHACWLKLLKRSGRFCFAEKWSGIHILYLLTSIWCRNSSRHRYLIQSRSY